MILSNTMANSILDVLRGYTTTIGPFNKLYVGVINSNGSEVSGGSYSRLEVDASPAIWTATQGAVDAPSSGTTKEITNRVSFDFGTINSNWGSVDRLRIFTTSNGTDYLFDCKFQETTVASGDSFMIDIGDFVIGYE